MGCRSWEGGWPQRLQGQGVQGGGSERRGGVGSCVQGGRLCAYGVRGELAAYWGRENPTEWVGGVEGRGLHRLEFWGWARAAGRPGIECWEWLGEGEPLWRPRTALLSCAVPSAGHFPGLCSSPPTPPPPLTLPAPRIRLRAAPLPHQLSRWEGKKLPQVRWSELAACESLNSRTEEEVGFDRE